MVISVNKLGFGAYIKMKSEQPGSDTSFLGFKNNAFEFESKKTLEQWRVEYLNSCCSKHDSILCELRKYYFSKQRA